MPETNTDMRIAYCGNFEPEFSTENDVRIAFEGLGHEVVKLQENRDRFDRVREVAIESDLVLFTGTWDNEDPGRNPDAQPLIESLDTFHECAKRGIPTATYHLDTFWTTSRGGRRWWLNPMFRTAHIFTADGDREAEWKALGVNHHWLRPGVRHTATTPGTFREEFACDVAFVGSNGKGYHEDVWPYRRELVDQLRAMCERNGWSFRNPGGDEPKVGRGEMNDAYASYRVTVGDSLCPKREDSRYWSDRAYEAPARGGFLIMPYIETLIVEDYDEMLPSYKWGEFQSLEAEVAHWLGNDADREVRRHACHAIASDSHTYLDRMTELLETVGLG